MLALSACVVSVLLLSLRRQATGFTKELLLLSVKVQESNKTSWTVF